MTLEKTLALAAKTDGSAVAAKTAPRAESKPVNADPATEKTELGTFSEKPSQRTVDSC